jgi:hypothetical protein
MSEPTSTLSMLSLATRISKEAGTAYRGTDGTSRAMPPVDIDDLADIKQVINDGIRQFEADAPATGWQWRKRILQVNISNVQVTGTADDAGATSLTDATLEDTYDEDDDLNGYWIYIDGETGEGSYAQITDYTASGGVITVADWLDEYGNAGGTDPAADSTYIITQYETVAGDIGRIPLPEYFGGEVAGPIGYYKDAEHKQWIGWTSEAIIRNRRQSSDDSGYPFMAAIRSLEPVQGTLGPTRRYELILYPEPSQADVLEFPYTLMFNGIDFESGVATGGGATTVADTTRDEPDDYFNGWRVDIIAGTGRGSYATVTDYTGSTGTFTVADWLNSLADPAADSIYFVQPANNMHPAGAKFDEVIQASCLAEAEQYFENISAGHIERYTQKALPKAYDADARSKMFVKIGSQPRQERIWSLVEKDE